MAFQPSEWTARQEKMRAELCLPLDLRARTLEFANLVLGTLCPYWGGATGAETQEIPARLQALKGAFAQCQARFGAPGAFDPADLLDRLPALHDHLMEDARAVLKVDPAARSLDEVLLAYPGVWAITVQRLAHQLFLMELPLLPRLLTEHAHHRTGIDMHPGARIGRRFVIDHGTGVVIGETAIIGDDVTLYQGVTLGALAVSRDQVGAKRHPTLEDEVVVYAGATILGGHTVVGRGSIVGGNVWLTESVPARSVVSRRSEVRARTDATSPELEFHI